jgi:acetyl esterase/lipase
MSWQAHVVNALTRVVIRRRLPGWRPGPEGAAFLRGIFGQPRRLRAWRARQATVTKTPSAPAKGEWVLPRDGIVDGGRTILYLHGGGYLFCTEETHRPITTSLANRARARVYAPAYRLAPEHRFPAAVDDAQASVESQIVVAGDSAGGGLALALLIARRDAGAAPLAGALLFSPWTDLAATGDTIRSNADSDALFVAPGIAELAKEYLGATPATNPLASPHYGDVRGLPPITIQVSAQEVLCDDSRRMAAKLREAGVPVSIREWPTVVHVWQMFTPWLPEAVEALDEAAAWVRARVPA